MATETKIQWTDSTFNPWRGCTKIASGCANCYADTLAKRNPKTLGIWGLNGTRVLASPAMWKEPVTWNAEAQASGETHRVFCASLADIFEDWQGEVSLTAKDFGRGILSLDDIRAELFKLIDATPHLTWQILTKRPENIRRMWGGIDAERHSINIQCGHHGQYRRNVHLLYSASDQYSFDAGVDQLVWCRDLVPVVGLSIEPLIGPIRICDDILQRIGWVIVGGESGPNARPCALEWIDDIRRQCQSAGVPCFIKQLGSFPVTTNCNLWDYELEQLEPWGTYAASARIELADKKGGDWSEWPEDLRVREFPKH